MEVASTSMFYLELALRQLEQLKGKMDRSDSEKVDEEMVDLQKIVATPRLESLVTLLSVALDMSKPSNLTN